MCKLNFVSDIFGSNPITGPSSRKQAENQADALAAQAAGEVCARRARGALPAGARLAQTVVPREIGDRVVDGAVERCRFAALR